WPLLNMKKMRCLLVVLSLALGLCAQRAQAQVAAETMTFSIICQYVTNTYVTNLSKETVTTNAHVVTVLLNSANLVKAMAADLFRTNWTTNWPRWDGASIVYEQNLETGNYGIFMRFMGRQTNVSSFFTSPYSTNGYANMFSVDVPSVFSGTNYDSDGTNSLLPVAGGGIFIGGPPASDNLAYLTFTSSNAAFNLFGYSQGTILETVFDKEGDVGKVNKAQIIGAGTFSLNLTTNFLFVTTNNAVPATNYPGLAHGTIYMAPPYHLDIEPPEGP
ncbi:MAG TPA: hypothetical protein VGR14_02760, partial [Verrucomicrobiae bacterium]|nr:hypothetical protein [Verrucomicrobiae bacterium]